MLLNCQKARQAGGAHDNPFPKAITIGWRPSCECEASEQRGRPRVFDPFGGSGTVAYVARKNGCDCTLIELSPKYCELIKSRLAQMNLFAEGGQ